jgi:hypothetical protein
MTNMKLVLNMLAAAATTEISKKRKPILLKSRASMITSRYPSNTTSSYSIINTLVDRL